MLVMRGKVKDDEQHRATSRLMLKTIRNNLGCKFSENVLATSRVDEIGGMVRSEPTIMLVDFDYRTKSTQGNTDNIESGLQSLGFAQLSIFQPDREHVTDPNAFLQTARSLRHHLKTSMALGSKTTVHVWFSFAAVMKFNPTQHGAKMNVPEGFFNKFTDILVEIQKDVARPILVCLLPDGEFHGVTIDQRKVASTFEQQLKAKGIMSTTTNYMWRALFAIGKMPHKIRQGAGKDLTWAIVEKVLFRQKMMLMGALEKVSIEDLNGRAVGYEKIGIEKAVLDRCTVPTIFKEEYDQSASTRKPVASDRVIGSMKSSEYISRTSTWEEARFGMMTPVPRTAECEFWLEVPRGANVYLCDRCASGNDATFFSNTTCPHSCLNCSANWSRDSAYGIEKDEVFIMQQLGRVAGRLYDVYSKDAEWTSLKAKHDLRSFLVAATKVFKFSTSDKELKDLHKTISNLGALRVPVYHFANRCRQGHCRRVGVIREVRNVDGQDRYFYQMTYDGGNVAYKDFLTALLTEDEYIGLFRGKSRSETSAEGMGDIVECWMGTYFPQLFERWGDQLEECRYGLESSFWTYQAAFRDSTTDNTRDGRQHYIDGGCCKSH
eukprot:s1874_g12.t1